MYLKRVRLENIRAIEKLEITFQEPAGWHILIGDNGTGKSTIIKAIALSLVGEIQAEALRQSWTEWVRRPEEPASIRLDLLIDEKYDEIFDDDIQFLLDAEMSIETQFGQKGGRTLKETYDLGKGNTFRSNDISGWEGFFSAAYGPYRRFRGGSPEWSELFKSDGYQDLVAHLTVFDESVALSESIAWLQELQFESLEKNAASAQTLDCLKLLINSDEFLPHSTELVEVGSRGVFFLDGNGNRVSVNQLSDGYRSVLSLTFELLRQLVRVYGIKSVFRKISQGEMYIDLPGVVLIDEIDAHLHPTWQTRIGQWFSKYFPKIQFIVTTHSPLICRAAERGSIWQLAAPGTDSHPREITGPDRDRLIYGNVLDAFGTEVFGTNVSISEESVRRQEKLVKLSKKKLKMSITEDEEEFLNQLKQTFTTDAPIEL